MDDQRCRNNGPDRHRKIQTWAWALAAVFTTACGEPFLLAPEEPNLPGADADTKSVDSGIPSLSDWVEQQPYLLSPWVERLLPDDLQGVTLEADRVLLNADAYEELELYPGLLLWAPRPSDEVDSFLRRVVEVESVDSTIVVLTEPAGLEELFITLDLRPTDTEVLSRLLGTNQETETPSVQRGALEFGNTEARTRPLPQGFALRGTYHEPKKFAPFAKKSFKKCWSNSGAFTECSNDVPDSKTGFVKGSVGLSVKPTIKHWGTADYHVTIEPLADPAIDGHLAVCMAYYSGGIHHMEEGRGKVATDWLGMYVGPFSEVKNINPRGRSIRPELGGTYYESSPSIAETGTSCNDDHESSRCVQEHGEGSFCHHGACIRPLIPYGLGVGCTGDETLDYYKVLEANWDSETPQEDIRRIIALDKWMLRNTETLHFFLTDVEDGQELLDSRDDNVRVWNQRRAMQFTQNLPSVFHMYTNETFHQGMCNPSSPTPRDLTFDDDGKIDPYYEWNDCLSRDRMVVAERIRISMRAWKERIAGSTSKLGKASVYIDLETNLDFSLDDLAVEAAIELQIARDLGKVFQKELPIVPETPIGSTGLTYAAEGKFGLEFVGKGSVAADWTNHPPVLKVRRASIQLDTARTNPLNLDCRHPEYENCLSLDVPGPDVIGKLSAELTLKIGVNQSIKILGVAGVEASKGVAGKVGFEVGAKLDTNTGDVGGFCKIPVSIGAYSEVGVELGPVDGIDLATTEFFNGCKPVGRISSDLEQLFCFYKAEWDLCESDVADGVAFLHHCEMEGSQACALRELEASRPNASADEIADALGVSTTELAELRKTPVQPGQIDLISIPNNGITAMWIDGVKVTNDNELERLQRGDSEQCHPVDGPNGHRRLARNTEGVVQFSKSLEVKFKEKIKPNDVIRILRERFDASSIVAVPGYTDYACYGPELASRDNDDNRISVYLFTEEQDNGVFDGTQNRHRGGHRLSPSGAANPEYPVGLDHLPKAP